MNASPAPEKADNHELILADRIGSFRHDPLGHVLFVYPWGEAGTKLADQTGPRPWQREVLQSIGERLRAGAVTAGEVIQEAVASGHGIGKSTLVAWLVKWALDTVVDTRAVITANTDTQLRTKTWPEVAKWHQMAINSHWFTFTATSLFSARAGHDKTWRADIVPWSENNTEAFAGLHNEGKRLLLVFDEASAIADKIWEVAEGALTDENTEIIWAAFGNPTRNTGRFRDCFGKQRHRWKTRHIDSRTVDGTNKTQIAKWIEDYGEDSDFVRIRVRGEFPRAGSNQFIDSETVDHAKARKPEKDLGAPLILAVDVARYGDDKSVARFRRGRDAKSFKAWKWRGINTMELAGHVAGLIERYQPDAVVVDGDGVGAGVVDRLRELKFTVHEFHGGERPHDQKLYFNRRAEVWGLARDWLKAGCIDDDRELEDDLLGPEYGFDPKGRYQLEKKEDMKERGLPSPDDGDAFAMTFAVNPARRDIAELSGHSHAVADGTPEMWG